MSRHGRALTRLVIHSDDAGLAELTGRLAAQLLRQGLRLVTAESCTGGWVAKLCTDQPGSSRWFDHGLVTYSNASKQHLVAVPADTLARFGAVSRETVRAMARGAQGRDPRFASLAISGVAGPDGGTDQKPVGLVWCGWALPDGSVDAACETFEGDRDAIRRQSVAMAMEGLCDRLSVAAD